MASTVCRSFTQRTTARRLVAWQVVSMMKTSSKAKICCSKKTRTLLFATFFTPQQKCLLCDKMQGEKRKTSTLNFSWNETMLHHTLKVFVSSISPPLVPHLSTRGSGVPHRCSIAKSYSHFPEKPFKWQLMAYKGHIPTFLLTEGFTFWKAVEKCLCPTPRGLCSRGAWFSIDTWQEGRAFIHSRKAAIQASRTSAARSAPLQRKKNCH